MGKFEDYVQEVMGWNEEWKKFLQSEQVDREDDIWKKLDGLTEVLETVQQPGHLNEQQLRGLQSKVEELHHNMEEYFIKRQEIGTIFMRDPFVEVGKHTLPPLPYSYDALEPVISEEIMRLHHTKHHQSYVDGLNKAEKKLEDARKSGDFSLVKHWSRELAFHGSGHYLHTIFWSNMSPNGGGKPSGKLLKEIEKYFGSYEAFKMQFTEAAKAVEGVGWAILVWSPRARRLEVLQSERHMILTQWDTIPLLVLDVWEHAYYLQYKNERAKYVDKWWDIVNWNDVEQRFLKAKQLTWKPY
ncbi:Fe-Mn family superoxide dismutase [Robertmurraya sp. Marseille-Q9965]